MRALNGLLHRLTAGRISGNRTSLKSQQIRKTVRPKRTAFEALEERCLLSGCVPPSADSVDQAAVDAYNNCLAAETNITQTPVEDTATTVVTGDTLTADVAAGDTTGVVTTETMTFAMGDSVPADTFIVFADDTGDALGADSQPLAISGFSIDSAGTLRVDRPVYATAAESTAGSESASGDTSGITSTDMSTVTSGATTDGGATSTDSGSSGPAAATADPASTTPPSTTSPAPTMPTSFTIDISSCSSGSRNETTTGADGSTTVIDESWSYCYSFHATYDFASGSITVDATTNSSHDLEITYTGSSRTYTSITGSDYDFELHLSGNMSGGTFSGTFSLDVSASNNSEWHETETLSGSTTGVYMLDTTSNSDFTLHLARTASGRDFELTAGHDFTWNESLAVSGDVSGAYTLDVTDDGSVTIEAHWGGSSGDTLDILASASFTWNESANFTDSGGLWSFSLNESASASFILISTTGTSSDFLMLSESAAYSVTMHDHATFSGDVTGSYTFDVFVTSNNSFSLNDTAGSFSLSDSEAGTYSIYLETNASSSTGSSNLTVTASGTDNFVLTANGTSGGTVSGSYSVTYGSTRGLSVHANANYGDSDTSVTYTVDANQSSTVAYSESGSYSGNTLSGTYSLSLSTSTSLDFDATVTDGACTLTIDEATTHSVTYTESGNIDGSGITAILIETSTQISGSGVSCTNPGQTVEYDSLVELIKPPVSNATIAAPTQPDGSPSPPSVPLPSGKGGKTMVPNSWRPTPATGPRGGIKWVPRFPVPSTGGGQPQASWDPEHGHWDVDWGNGERERYLPDGTKVDHDNKPITDSMPDPETVAKVGIGVSAGALLYWVISEVSRLFPPRNLVPIP